MDGLKNPRGPLPARVYWVRRIAVLGVALLLVVGLGRLLSGGSDGSSDGEQAVQAGSGTSETTETSEAADAESSLAPTQPAVTATKAAKRKKAKPAPAVPDGECSASDLVVDPEVARAVAGRDVVFWLHVRTTGRAACTWPLDADTLALKITSGSDRIWVSSQCTDQVPDVDVVARAAQDRVVRFAWDARRSDEGCTDQREWVDDPGYYHLEAAALGGEPSDTRFELVLPSRPTVTAQPEPSDTRDAEAQATETKSSDATSKR